MDEPTGSPGCCSLQMPSSTLEMPVFTSAELPLPWGSTVMHSFQHDVIHLLSLGVQVLVLPGRQMSSLWGWNPSSQSTMLDFYQSLKASCPLLQPQFRIFEEPWKYTCFLIWELWDAPFDLWGENNSISVVDVWIIWGPLHNVAIYTYRVGVGLQQGTPES